MAAISLMMKKLFVLLSIADHAMIAPVIVAMTVP